jgi:5-methyltetrahydrofolate--homocysteine methyltransferase
MQKNILDAIKNQILVLDGGMGTELIRYGISQGVCPELWNVENPDKVKKIHKSYFDAGSDIILTNSFGGNKIKLSAYGLENRSHELNYATAKLANEVKPNGKFVGGSMGPVGKFLKPHGNFTEDEFENVFSDQAKALALGKVDFLLIETMYDLRETLCALRGARKVTKIPVFVTMTFNHIPKGFFTMMGNSYEQCIQTLQKEGVPVIGTNCTLDSKEMADLIELMHKKTELPLIAQANAGQPSISSSGETSYSQSSEDYLKYIPKMLKNGVKIIGGCCGTTPKYIEKIAELVLY